MKRAKVMVAMSGGVDSSTVAAVLSKEYDVVGVTMRLWNPESDNKYIEDAKAMAKTIGIEHHVVDLQSHFKKTVVDYFASEYSSGRTPNPCVVCNAKIKFGRLAEEATKLGASFLATGHYLKVSHTENGPSVLYKGEDRNKDQSYFLCGVDPEQLKKCMFPLADMTKAEVREIAKSYGLSVADKPESQEICFVPRRYSELLEKHYPESLPKEGDIVDRDGAVLGRHDGIHKYTIGQRKGLGNLPTTEPKYVVALDGKQNRVVVDSTPSSVKEFFVDEINWHQPFETIDQEYIEVMVRYHAKLVSCTVRQSPDGWQVTLNDNAPFVAPGQAAVFYQGNKVLGGGFIR